MVQKDQTAAETEPNFSIYKKELTVTPALKPEQISGLRSAIINNGNVLPEIIGLSQGFGEASKRPERSTLLRFGNDDVARGAIGLVKSVIVPEG